jgi:hypothetical protein
MRILMALLAASLVFAGCLDGGSSEDPTSAKGCPKTPFDPPGIRIVPTTVDPIDDDRDNATVFETTNVRTCSLPAIGWTPLRDPAAGGPHKYIGEIDMRGDLNLGAVAVLGNGEAHLVYILDITERANPVVLSTIEQAGTYVVDVKFSDDGAILYTASQTLAVDGLAALPAPTAPVGFTAYNIQDPANPVYLGTVVDPTVGCHMLDPVQVAAGQDAVFCISQHLRSYLVQRDQDVLLNFGFVDYVPTLPAAPPAVGDPTCLLPTGCLLPQGPHDVTVFHEGGSFGDGRSYAIVSHWGEGVKVLDITDAPLLQQVGPGWVGEGATHYAGNVHTAMMFVVGEDRYIVASPEYTSAGTVPGFWVLDANDLANLKLVAEWYHPGLHESQGLYLTTHQWQVAPTGPDVTPDQVRLYFTYNHAGVWVLDFGHILAGNAQEAILGFNLARTPLPEDHVSNAVLMTWDINVVDGYIYGSDRATGLWIFHYSGDELGDVRLRGFA